MVPAGLRAAQKKKQASENLEQDKNNLGSFFANNFEQRATLNKCSAAQLSLTVFGKFPMLIKEIPIPIKK